jgi:hypothetical protein
MLRHLQIIALVCAIAILGSCNSMPDTARYIPQNAIVAVGIHTNEIGKKIAWNAITGSKLLDELKKRKLADNNTSIDPEAMGIELNSVTYIYMKSDKRFSNGNRVTALIPLEDAAKWEDYVKRSFPNAAVKTQGERKEAMLANGMYTGWSKNLLIVMNTFEMPKDYNVTQYMSDTHIEGDDTTNITVSITDTVAQATPTPTAPAIDEAQLLAEMDNAFNIKKENSLVENKRFTKLETGGHDITVWVNYDEIMSAYGVQGMSGMMGINLSNALWKDAAFAAGFDFEKGKITGNMQYYSPEEMKEVAKEMGKESASKEMIDMLPLKQPNMAFTWHLSPKGLKGTLDKMGLLGFANLALSQQNLSADYIFDALTGDMAFVVNNFKVKTDTSGVSYYNMDMTGDSTAHTKNYTPDAKFLYALKIGKKENFDKLLQLAVTNKVLINTGNNTYKVGDNNQMMVVTNDKYLVCANDATHAQAFLQGNNKKDKKDENIGSTLNHPVGMYINLQSMFNSFNPGDMSSAKDSLMFVTSKNLLQRVDMHGGEFNSGSFNYDISVSFMNKEENALLQLIDFAVKMSEIEKQAEPNAVVYK